MAEPEVLVLVNRFETLFNLALLLELASPNVVCGSPGWFASVLRDWVFP